MTDFENDLRRTLQRREPRRDLTKDVMDRIEVRPRVPSWRGILAAAAMLLLMAGGWAGYREYRLEQQGLLAKQQLMLAVRITTEKLTLAQTKINELNRRRIGHDQ